MRPEYEDITVGTAKYAMKMMWDTIIYGTAVSKLGCRKWYNPVRWLKGKYYIKCINPGEVYK